MRVLAALLVAASSIRGAAAQQVDTTLWTRLHFRFVGPEGNRAIAAGDWCARHRALRTQCAVGRNG